MAFWHRALLIAVVAAAAGLGAMRTAHAQSFGQVIVFGDSSVDSGWYRATLAPGGGVNFNTLFPAAVLAGGGVPTTRPGLMTSEALAALFGLTADPANQPGGTNFATSGARLDLVNGPGSGLFNGAIPVTAQINAYLAANGGHANPNALFLISAGGNDISFAFNNFAVNSAAAFNYMTTQVDAFVIAAQKLHDAGAQYIIVPNQAHSLNNNADVNAYRLFLDTAMWNGLAAAGINFIPADINSVRLAITANPSSFGFEFIDTAHPACTKPVGIASAWALLCSADPSAPSTFVTPDADRTRLFADDQHLTTAGQKIFADYYYSLIVAPSLISFLPENAVKTRSKQVATIEEQIATSALTRGPLGINAWVSGDIGALALDNYPGFPNDPNTPLILSAGIDSKPIAGVIIGGAIAVGHLKSGFDRNSGSFTQDEFAASLYAALDASSWWATAVAGYSHLSYDVNRQAPIGITTQFNDGHTNGHNLSLALQAGLKFKMLAVTHGPVAGLILQRVSVGDFVEQGSFTSLGFSSQVRNSAVGMLGYRASIDLGSWTPYAQITWNHEFANTGRDVTASLTTIVAPGFTLPAVVLGKDWGSATVGTRLRLAPNMTATGAFSIDFSQHDVTNYGGRAGLNIAF